MDLEATEAALLEAQLGGQGADASAIIRRAYESGVAVETIADRVIGPAMAKVGHQWEAVRIDRPACPAPRSRRFEGGRYTPHLVHDMKLPYGRKSGD
jgi:hypothetical protein